MLLGAVCAVLLAGCGSANPLGGGAASGDLRTLTVGSADFAESRIVAEIYAQALEANDFTVARQLGIGSRETYVPALRDNSIDLVPEYTGNLLQYFDSENTVTEAEAIELALYRVLPGDLAMLVPSQANDSDTVSVTAETAERWNLQTIGDLAPYSAEVRFAGTSEFASRSEGLPGLRETYGLDISEANFVPIGDGGGPATVRALADGTVTAANIFSTSPAIEENDLVVLEDPENNFLAAYVVPLVNAQKMSPELKTVLDAVSAELTTEGLLELNASVSGNDGLNLDVAAERWVQEHGFDQPVLG